MKSKSSSFPMWEVGGRSVGGGRKGWADDGEDDGDDDGEDVGDDDDD